MTMDVIKTDEAEEAVQSLDLVAGRRAFMQALGYGAIGAAVFGAAAGAATPAAAGDVPPRKPPPTDHEILNFALNLEYLESAFYSFAFSGADIPAGDTTGGAGQPPGQLTGGAQVPFASPLVKAYAQEIASEERKHVQVLRAVLGAKAVSRPAINIGSAFQTAATAAGISGNFNAYANDTNFLLASYIFEDVGVTAYHGAAGLLQNTTFRDYAAGILAVEAYHAGIIRTSLFAESVLTSNPALSTDTTKISNLRSKLANGKAGVDDIGIGKSGTSTLATVDAPNAIEYNDLPGGDAIAYTRTTSQVLNIVYGDPNGTPGLFFPNGMHGAIK